MTRLASTGLLLTALFLALAGQSAAARVHETSSTDAATGAAFGVPVVEERRFQSGCMSLSQAVSRAKRQYGGRIVSAETRGKSHVIKVLTADNKVKTVRYPAC